MPKVPTEGKKKKNVPTEVVTGNRKRRAKKSEQEMEVLADNGHVDPEMDSEDEEVHSLLTLKDFSLNGITVFS